MSEIKIINDKDYIRSYWHEKYQCYVNEWNGVISKENFKEAVMIGFDYMMENNVKVHLADAREMKTGWNGAEEWLHQHFWPKLVENSLTHFGIIVAENVFMEFASIQMEDKMKAEGIDINYKVFDKVEEALKWSAAVQEIPH